MKLKSIKLILKKIFFLFALVILLLISCNKEIYESVLVNTVAVNHIGNDSVEVIGNVVNNSGFKMVYSGFCMSALPNPELMDNQILINGQIGNYKAEYCKLEQNSIYYFRSFAANEVEFVYGNILEYRVPFSKPPIVPCTLVDNRIEDNGFNFNVSSTNTNESPLYGGNYRLSIDCVSSANKMYYIEFMQTPQNGVYTTSDYSYFNSNIKNVFMNFQTNFNKYYINPNGKVYVSVDSVSKKMSISFCDLTYEAFSSDFPLKGNVTID